MGIEDLEKALAECTTICIDTMVFIYLLDQNSRYSDVAETILETVETGKVNGVTSTITIAEVLSAPAQTQNTQAMLDYELYLTNFPNLTLYAPDESMARLIATTRANTRLKLPDAIQVATAIYAGADAIISNDKKWRNKFVTPKLLLLEDYLSQPGENRPQTEPSKKGQ